MIKQTDEAKSRRTQILGSVMLVVCSALAVLIATSPGSVTVFRPGDSATRTFSFFEQIPDVPAGVCLLFAGAGSCLSLLLSIAELILNRSGLRTGIMVTALASMTLAVLPLLAEKSAFVLPNMMHPLLMGVVCVGTYMLRKLYK